MISDLLPSSLLAPGRRSSDCRLLVSVQNAAEAQVAVANGADIIDAKDPRRGPLGPVDARELPAIAVAVGGRLPLSVAIGELDDRAAIAAGGAAAAGVTFVKVGCEHGRSVAVAIGRIGRVIESLQQHAAPGHPCRLILAAYADGSPGSHPDAVAEVAARCGAGGVLLDTLHKDGPGLLRVMQPDEVAAWVTAGQAAGLLVALAGSLTLADIPAACATGADVIGVRGAACDGGREGPVSATHVRALANGLHSVVGSR